MMEMRERQIVLNIAIMEVNIYPPPKKINVKIDLLVLRVILQGGVL